MARDTSEGITINVDFDGVVANLIQGIIWKERLPYQYEDLTHWNHPVSNNVWEKISEPHIYEFIPPIPDAIQHLGGMWMSGYKIVIASNHPPESLEYIINWLNNWGARYDDIILTEDKNTAGPHILIDDKPKNVWRYADRVGPAILFHQPWNQNWAIPSTPFPILRGKGWDDSLQKIRNLINVQHLWGVR